MPNLGLYCKRKCDLNFPIQLAHCISDARFLGGVPAAHVTGVSVPLLGLLVHIVPVSSFHHTQGDIGHHSQEKFMGNCKWMVCSRRLSPTQSNNCVLVTCSSPRWPSSNLRRKKAAKPSDTTVVYSPLREENLKSNYQRTLSYSCAGSAIFFARRGGRIVDLEVRDSA